MDEFIERRIVTGLVVSEDYVRKIRPFWQDELLESPELQRIAQWCLQYFDQYNKAPDRDIEMIYMDHLKHGRIQRQEADDIQAILQRISDDYERGEQFNSAYLYDKSVEYFRNRELQELGQQIDILTEQGRTNEAAKLQATFKPASFMTSRGLELNTEETFIQLRQSFNRTSQSILGYPGALGELLNDHLVRGGFIAWLAPEKRGKSFILLDMGLRAIRQKSNVAFFQAGDMTQDQQLKRICIYLSKRSDNERYCVAHWRPTGDCIWNQIDKCDRADRNSTHGIYDNTDLDAWTNSRQANEAKANLTAKSMEFPKYVPCESRTCKKRLGTVWLEHVPECSPLSADRAERDLRYFFTKYKRRFKLATYSNGTLTIGEIKACLDEWERGDDFVADLIIVDYADLLFAETREFRHRQDEIWKGLRALSQERHCLVATATQADAASYTKDRLGLTNFSEDKRKYAHVTAMWGLNQDREGREKKLGIMRINELVVREGDFSPDTEVYILQDLAIARPFLGSYFSKYSDRPLTKKGHV